MVKKKTGGSKLRSKAKRTTEASQSEEMQEQQEGPLPPHKLQKKITKRVNFLERVAASKLAAKPALKKKRSRKRAGATLVDLSTLEEALGQAAGEANTSRQKRQKGLGVGGLKARSKITAQETVRLQQVLAHPHFKADAFAAIANHLSATLTPPEAPKKARKNISGSQKRKQKQQRARAASEMDSA